ncbi:MAG: YjbQ family protein [Chromatiales bacterium]|nr:MAG: YjbQ family protein [Chromatiales bacterium]
MIVQREIVVDTPGRGTTDVTREIQRVVAESGITAGTCQVFLQHTSASLMLCENADPDVRRDLDAFMARLVPDGDSLYRHQSEGPDDMPAHVRSVLTHSSLSLPVNGGACALGTWQGVYLWEHRTRSHRRRLLVTVHGEL